MTEKMTSIRLPSGKDAGFMDWGEQDAETMIATYREMAVNMRARADEIDAAADDDFRIEGRSRCPCPAPRSADPERPRPHSGLPVRPLFKREGRMTLSNWMQENG